MRPALRPPACLAVSALLLLGSMAAAQDPAVGPSSRVRAHVHLIVLSDFPTAWIGPLSVALESDLGVQAIVVRDPVPLPASAYYAPRRRYRAERLLNFLGGELGDRPAAARALGLTSRDISTTTERFHDWGILGLADLGGRAAVVSSFRMRRRARNPEHALWRMTTTAVHEVGHMLGLPHCDEARCLMRDAEGTMDTVDAGDGELGPRCRARLERRAPLTLPRLP